MIYPCTILDTPDEVIVKVNKILMDFLWNWKMAKIRKDYLVRTIDKGGIKLPCFDCKIKSWKFIWPIRCLNATGTTPLWCHIISAMLPSGITFKYLLKCNPLKEYLKKYCPLLSEFYINIIILWSNLTNDSNIDTKEKIT